MFQRNLRSKWNSVEKFLSEAKKSSTVSSVKKLEAELQGIFCKAFQSRALRDL